MKAENWQIDFQQDYMDYPYPPDTDYEYTCLKCNTCSYAYAHTDAKHLRNTPLPTTYLEVKYRSGKPYFCFDCQDYHSDFCVVCPSCGSKKIKKKIIATHSEGMAHYPTLKTMTGQMTILATDYRKFESPIELGEYIPYEGKAIVTGYTQIDKTRARLSFTATGPVAHKTNTEP